MLKVITTDLIINPEFVKRARREGHTVFVRYVNEDGDIAYSFSSKIQAQEMLNNLLRK